MTKSVLKEAESYFIERTKFYGNDDRLFEAVFNLEMKTGTKPWKVWDHIKGIVANIYAEHPDVSHRVNNTVSKIPEKYTKPANELAIDLINTYYDGLDYYVEECL